jgi:hypothetical protein
VFRSFVLLFFDSFSSVNLYFSVSSYPVEDICAAQYELNKNSGHYIVQLVTSIYIFLKITKLTHAFESIALLFF